MPNDKQGQPGQNSQNSQTNQQGKKGSDLSNQERPSQGTSNRGSSYGSGGQPSKDNAA